jgi:hypothetical protein
MTSAALNAAVGAVWTSYTPTWTGATTNPVYGNAALTAAYTKIGKTVFLRMYLTMGSTTTFGSGSWSWSLPEVAAAVPGFTGKPIWSSIAAGNDTGTAVITGLLKVDSGASAFYIGAIGNNGSPWNATFPHTWANTDEIFVNFAYEAATF